MLVIIGIVTIYLLPTVVGLSKRNIGAIFMLNLLLGWTFI